MDHAAHSCEWAALFLPLRMGEGVWEWRATSHRIEYGIVKCGMVCRGIKRRIDRVGCWYALMGEGAERLARLGGVRMGVGIGEGAPLRVERGFELYNITCVNIYLKNIFHEQRWQFLLLHQLPLKHL